MVGWPPYQELYQCDPPAPVLYEASQPKIARQAGVSSPGPWKQRAPYVWRRRNGSLWMRKVISMRHWWCSITWFIVWPIVLYGAIATPMVLGVAAWGRVRAVPFPKKMWAPKYVPPATRKASPREVIQFSENPMQIGHPASMDADAFSGYSVMGHQSWDVACHHCDARKTTGVMLEGRLSQGHDNLCRKEKVG